MIELKVYCDCGQKYKFDVEPVHNQMPFTVACPICQRDGTEKANAMLQQMAVFKPMAAEPAPGSVMPTPFEGASTAGPPKAPLAPPASASARIRIHLPVPPTPDGRHRNQPAR